MTRLILCCVSALALATATAGAQAAKDKPVAPSAAAQSAEDDCEARIQKLATSDAEGAERLAAKWEVVAFCAKEFKRDKTVQRLVNECAKYLEQPVIKQLIVTECQLAAYNYGSALRFLKEEYRK
jgi:hypothetical protein